MSSTQQILEVTEAYCAHNYHPLPVVISYAEGVWVEDLAGKRYIDMLSSYSALNQGHRNPKILEALRKQLEKVTLTSRAFHNDQLGPLCKELAELCGMEMVLLMNTGAEAVETAIKTARKWGYTVKGVEPDRAEIVVCEGNFHGRTITVVSFSSEPAYREGFGPLTPGFKIIEYGDAAALRQAIGPNTVGFLVEPIQGEGGVLIPPAGYLRQVRQICDDHKVLLMADEIQTGLGRTGAMFACQLEDVQPDIYILGKALGGGVLPISAVVSSKEILGVFQPGDHGSTFGGNPLACAVARAALGVLIDDKLPERARELGGYLMDRLSSIGSRRVKDVRGRGLLVGVELTEEAGPARPYCETLMDRGVLCKETHEMVIRFAPPLVITREEIDLAVSAAEQVLVGGHGQR